MIFNSFNRKGFPSLKSSAFNRKLNFEKNQHFAFCWSAPSKPQPYPSPLSSAQLILCQNLINFAFFQSITDMEFWCLILEVELDIISGCCQISELIHEFSMIFLSYPKANFNQKMNFILLLYAGLHLLNQCNCSIGCTTEKVHHHSPTPSKNIFVKIISKVVRRT